MSAATSSRCLRLQHADCTNPKTCDCDCHLVKPEDAGITFVEVLPGRMGRPARPIVTAEGAAILRGNPGKWALVGHYDGATTAGTTAGNINRGKRADFQPDEWEAAGRRNPKGGSDLYLKFKGEAKLRSVGT